MPYGSNVNSFKVVIYIFGINGRRHFDLLLPKMTSVEVWPLSVPGRLPLVDGEDVPKEDHLLGVGHRVARVEVPQVGVRQHAPLLAVRRRFPLGLEIYIETTTI